ncbi:MAG TPA: chemotaxis protein CheW [Pirellulaceae bacterium]
MPDHPTGDTQEFCAFALNARPFGVPVRLVKEVHAPTAITPIPGAPPAVRGYVNLRGHLHLVLDPHECLTGASRDKTIQGSWIVFRADAGEAFAIQADRVTGIVSLDHAQIDRPTSDRFASSHATEFEGRLVSGYAKLDQDLVTLVDPAALFEACLPQNG